MNANVSPLIGIFPIVVFSLIARAEIIYDSKVIDEIKTWSSDRSFDLFKEKYEGKQFSDTGIITRYDRSFPSRVDRVLMYVEINSGSSSANRLTYCIVFDSDDQAGERRRTDQALKELQRRHPVGTRIKMSGTMYFWNSQDPSLRLHNFCQIE